MNVIVVGATGLAATSFLRKAVASDGIGKIWSFSRSEPSSTIPRSGKLNTFIQPADQWGKQFPQGADVMFSGIATTRASAGSLEKQRMIDHDLQIKLAQEAKDKGCSTFVLVSSGGASANSYLSYFRLKGEIEDDIAKLGFRRLIVLRPGALLGQREKPHGGFGESVITKVMPRLHRSWAAGLVGYPVKTDEIATATLKLLKTLPDGVHYIESKQILDLSSE